MNNIKILLLSFLLINYSLVALCLWWSSSSSSPSEPTSNHERATNTEFSLQSYISSEGTEIVDEAKKKMSVPDTCWHNAYRILFQSCSEITRNEEKKKRLAWMLADCFQVGSGRPKLPKCNENSPMLACSMKLNDVEHFVFLKFFMETNSICHQLQSESFKHQTERLVNDLKESAHLAEDKLEIINVKSNRLLEDSNQMHDSLTTLQEETNEIAQASKDIGSQIHDVLESSRAIFEQSKDIARFQVGLKEAQAEMSDVVKLSLIMFEESQKNLGEGIENLMKETESIEREVKVIGESMVNKMQELQNTANDIENVTSNSLEKHIELLDGQNVAIEGLDLIRKSQSEALMESRDTLERFSEYGRRQHEELLQRQAQIQNTHNHLHESSQAILNAQREFALKQSDIFSMIEKLYTLYKAILDESRFIKAFFFYACVSFILYMLTSTNQTFQIRVHLYLGLIIFLLIEVAIIKLRKEDDIINKIWVGRYTFLGGAFIQILYAIFTYRDIEKYDNQLLQTMLEKVCTLEKNTGMMLLQYESDTDDDRLSQYSWIEDEQPEDVDIKEDPDHHFEEITENSNKTAVVSKAYNLRTRNK